MTDTTTPQAPGRSPLVGWVLRANAQVSQTVAAMSWWRLLLLFIIVGIAGSMISDKLGLHHDHERKRTQGTRPDQVRLNKSPDGDSVVVTIGGRDAIRIVTQDRHATPPAAPASPPAPPAVPGSVPAPGAASAGAGAPRAPASGAATPASDASPASAEPAASAPAAPEAPIADEEDEEDHESWVNARIVTFRGILGDLGATVLIILFAYIVATKVIVRKAAESDAKVRSAETTAERETMERQLVQARLQVLQAQVEPHFLFNTLAAVDYLIETDPPRASQMQKALIRYLRGALPQMRQDSSTLGREFKLVQAYLELIKMRIEDRLEVALSVPEGLESAEFPPMMLQSLVENAIKHGIEPKPEGGKVTVAARIQNGQLWVEVSDTGVGLPEHDIFEGPVRGSGTGIGLRNIRERLSMLYPGKSRLVLRSDDATGTVVKIAVPYRVNAGAAGEEGGTDDAAPAAGGAA